MQACWSLEPTQRPTFDQICCFIQKELEMHKEQVRAFGEGLSACSNIASAQISVVTFPTFLSDGSSLVTVKREASRFPQGLKRIFLFCFQGPNKPPIHC